MKHFSFSFLLLVATLAMPGSMMAQDDETVDYRDYFTCNGSFNHGLFNNRDSYWMSGTSGFLIFDIETKELTLSRLIASSLGTLRIKKDLTIHLIGDNLIQETNTWPMVIDEGCSNLTIVGDSPTSSSLNLAPGDEWYEAIFINGGSSRTLTIKDCSVNLSGHNFGNGIFDEENMTNLVIDNAVVITRGCSYAEDEEDYTTGEYTTGFDGIASLTLNGCSIVSPQGAYLDYDDLCEMNSMFIEENGTPRPMTGTLVIAPDDYKTYTKPVMPAFSFQNGKMVATSISEGVNRYQFSYNILSAENINNSNNTSGEVMSEDGTLSLKILVTAYARIVEKKTRAYSPPAYAIVEKVIYPTGDINGDGTRSIEDVTKLVDMILEKEEE